MDRDNPLVFNPSVCMTSLSSSEDFVTLNSEYIDDLSLVPVNNSFEDFENKNLLNEDCEEEVLGQDFQPPEVINHPFEIMGIENTWNEDNSFASASAGDFPIPLPPPGGFDDIGCLDSEVQPSNHGPFQESDLGNLFSNESHTSEDVRDSSAEPGVCGLHNLGNTCFMSAGLQCLAASPALMHFFLSRPGAEKDSTHSLTDQFALLVHKIWSGHYSVLKPEEFKQALGINHAQFKDYRQHDCQEFLALLLDNLHEQLNLASCKSILSDISTAPPTPHSQCEALEDRDILRKAIVDSSDQESTTHTVASIDGLRCNHSSSSHSSDSSGESKNIFRLRPIPKDVLSFKTDSDRDESVGEVGSPQLVSTSILKQTVVNDKLVMTRNHVIDDLTSSNNLVTQSHLHKENFHMSGGTLLEKNEMATQYNNVSQCFRGLEDILKDAKTSNVNVLVTEQEINNEIRFDSEKFPKHENTRRRDPLENPNLTEFHNFDGKTVSVKRIKENNLLHDSGDSTSDCGEELDLESSQCFNNIKRMKLEESDKNHRMEFERKLRVLDEEEVECEVDVGEPVAACSSSGHSQLPHSLNDEIEADKYWDKHLGVNQSIVVDTFQGQFKSTVVCAGCGHVSVTYEPFMYLSVPVPHAMERQICVTFVPANLKESVQYLLTLNKQDKVIKLKEELVKVMSDDNVKSVALAEVLDSHIARQLDESSLLRYVNDTNRSIYAFELLPPPTSMDCTTVTDGETKEPMDLTPPLDDIMMGIPSCADQELPPLLEVSSNLDSSTREGGCGDGNFGCELMGPLTESEFEKYTAPSSVACGERGDGWKSCAICLEEMETDVRRHKSCSCILCESCIETSCKHHGDDALPCPVCGLVVKPETEFVPLDKLGDVKPTIRMLNVPIVFRLDTDGDGNNNKKTMKLFGHPHLVRLPNRLKSEDLYRAVDRLVPYSTPYTLLFVDGQGYHCSRCMYTMHCRGCRVPQDGEVLLQTGDTLAVRLSEPVEPVGTVQHPSMKARRSSEPLSLYDCLQAFSESEQLDEHNPWYCPMCQKNQCATKTLSVWRYPDFLIVYLKRFIFHDGVSVKLDNKVTFPLTGLKFNSPSILHQGSPYMYNLYACVCHFGGPSAGHYTAYTKHPRSGEWHYFNDEVVTKQKPQEEDYNNGYILFYQRQGVSFELSVPKLLSVEDSSKPNIDQLILDLDSSVEQDWQQENMAHSSLGTS